MRCRLASALVLTASLAACSDAPPLFPSVDLLILPPVGAAAAGAPETPDYPPPEESEPEPEPEPESASGPQSVSASKPEPAPAPATEATPSPIPATSPPARTHRVVAGAGFSYAIPAAWRELEPAALGVPTLVTAQRATSPIDGFVTNVTVAVEPFDGDVGTYGSLHVAAIVDGGALRDAWPTWIGAHDALDVEAGWSNLAGMPYLTLQRYVVDGRRAYVITCAAAVSAWQAERPQCEEIVESLRLD